MFQSKKILFFQKKYEHYEDNKNCLDFKPVTLSSFFLKKKKNL